MNDNEKRIDLVSPDKELFEKISQSFGDIEQMEKRVVLLERVFGRLMQIELRLDNLEFHSGAPLKPAINEILMDLKLRTANLEEQIGKPENPIRNDD